MAAHVGHHRLQAALGDQPAVGVVQGIRAPRKARVGAVSVHRRLDDTPILLEPADEGHLQVQMAARQRQDALDRLVGPLQQCPQLSL